MRTPMGVWQGVTMDSLKFQRSLHALPFSALQMGLMALWPHGLMASWPHGLMA
jgi:hypothetical protein